MTDPFAKSPVGRRAAWGIAALAIITLIALGTRRVAELERAERTVETDFESLRARTQAPHATRISARLGEAHLLADQTALFELCATSDLRALRGAFELVVLHIDETKVMLRVPLDDAHLAHVKGDAAFSCLVVGSGLIEHSGEYSVEAVWQDTPPSAAALASKLAVRVLAKPLLRTLDVALVAALGGALLLAVLALFLVPRHRHVDGSIAQGFAFVVPARERGHTLRISSSRAGATEAKNKLATRQHACGEVLGAKPLPESPAPASSRAYAILAPCVGLALVYACVQWPTASALFTLFKGELMLGLQVGLALLLASRAGPASTRALLGLGPARRMRALAGALLAWPCLVAAAKLSLRLVPSTGEAPIQTFISWPSGMFSAALLGVLLPIGEELFFRGFLFGSLLRFGKTAAAVSSVVAFGLLHAEQSWGNWGGLVAVFVSGAAMCALRMLTGSTWIAALCHLAYNLTLSLGSMLSALS